MATEHLFLEKQGHVATLYLNRPEKKNALTYEMWAAIPGFIEEVEADDEIKVLIIRGVNGEAFAAGADISEFETLRSTPEGAMKYNEKVLAAEAALYNCSKPIIAMIQKYCIGGGCEIAAACDLRFTSENGIFGITPAKLGLIYDLSATKNVVDLIGPSRAKDILFSGRFLDAQEAFAYGLVDHVYPDEEIVEKTYAYAEMVASRAQKTVKGAKKIIREILNGATEETEEIKQMILDSFVSSDYKEGVRAFLEKRQPQFKEV
ncbi:enoyl-CoA hydratase/carnithine racemase [Caldalkalibacillus uzonensis]|uniref:Enoyl-CoA hydratase/carnithine racemase n=1 Tax=Caldalkalibacillus uzonensis TaxID=353224 RepID=A0ABU0CU65_9BACI|nr:enoyl-CoA hydratase-related protein [Caldalkalibacillus uzonensis]MDQ0339955.1 enoyl-CoA hydratase/carnithine racemase [Caldalkalibacillus uzonensis]